MNRHWHLAFLTITFLGATAAGTAGWAQQELTKFDADEAFAQGQELFEQGNYEEAIDKFTTTTQIDNTNWQAYVLMGRALNELEAYEAAIQAIKQAIDLGGNTSAEAYNARGEAYLEIGQYDLARSDFDQAGELDRSNPEILANIGHMRVNFLGDPEGALRYLEDARTAAKPDDARAHRDKGLAHAQLREYDEAMEELGRAAELEPGDYMNFTTMAQVYLAQEDYESAIDAISKAIDVYEPEKRTDPKTFVDGYLTRSMARMALAADNIDDHPEVSREAYETVIADAKIILKDYEDRFPQSGYAYYRQGLAQRMLGQYGAAIESLTEAIQGVPPGTAAPYLGDAYLRRGICWHNQGYEDLARKDYERAIAVDFQSPLPHFWIGLSYAAEGNYREAINHYSEAVDKRDDYALAYVNRGLAYYQLQNYEKAIDNFNEAISHEPLEPEHYYKRGMAHLQLEEYDRAVTSFADALRKAPEMAKARQAMSTAQAALGNSNLAPLYQQQ